MPGEKTSVSDANGSATRSCGWDGKAFVVTLKPERGATREVRFPVSNVMFSAALASRHSRAAGCNTREPLRSSYVLRADRGRAVARFAVVAKQGQDEALCGIAGGLG